MSSVSAPSSSSSAVGYLTDVSMISSDLASNQQKVPAGTHKRVQEKALLPFQSLITFQKLHFPNILQELHLIPEQFSKALNGSVKARALAICKCIGNAPDLLKVALHGLVMERSLLEADLKEKEAYDILTANRNQLLNLRMIDKASSTVFYDSQNLKPTTLAALNIVTTEAFAFYLRYFKERNFHASTNYATVRESETPLTPIKCFTVSAGEQDVPELQNFQRHGTKEVKELAKGCLLLIQNKKYGTELVSCGKKASVCFMEMAGLYSTNKVKDILHIIVPGLSYLSILRLKSLVNGLTEEPSQKFDDCISTISERVDRALLKSKLQIELYQELFKALTNLAPAQGPKRTQFFKEYVFTILNPEAFAKFCGKTLEKPVEVVSTPTAVPISSKGKKKKKKPSPPPSLPPQTAVAEANTNSTIALAKSEASASASNNSTHSSEVTAETTNHGVVALGRDQKSEPQPAILSPQKIVVECVPQSLSLRLNSANAALPFQYASRVKRWFKLQPNEKVPFPEYAGFKADYLEKTRVRHAFSRAVDTLLSNRAFVHRQVLQTPKGKREVFHLVAQFEYSEQAYDRGVISYTVVNNVCFHRFFSLHSTSDFMNKRMEDIFDASQPTEEDVNDTTNQKGAEISMKEDFDALTEHPLHSYIQIADKINHTIITIFKIND